MISPGDDIGAIGQRAETMLAELGAISSDPARLTRLFLTPEHRRAADLVAQWMQAADMRVSEDALGTVRGQWQPQHTKRLLIGSHIDTVIDAGKYDGPLGVVAGILAVEQIARSGQALPFGIDVLAFGDEEGSRFPSTLTSSKACAGLFESDALTSLDDGGVMLRDAIKTYGNDPAKIAAAAYAPGAVLGYVEVHIEQGPVLEAQRQPLGVVSAIIGQSRMRVAVLGEAGHAGTVPMAMRHDALSGAAEMILSVEQIARAHDTDKMVATVGRIAASPGAANVIPGHVDFSVEVRSLTDTVRHQAIAEFKRAAQRVAAARKLTVSFEPYYETATTPCHPAFQDLLARSISDLGGTPITLPSGAGHDAQIMAKLCPSAMLFVRCRGGISHNPAEFASEADMGLAVAALVRFIALLAAKSSQAA